MTLAEAVSQKILKICNEKDISINKLSDICCMTQSTIQNLVQKKSESPKIMTIYRICIGLNISLKDFFDDSLFKDIKMDIYF